MQIIENENAIRKTRGMEIAKTSRIMKRERGGYVVPSQSGSGCYLVKYVDYKSQCECPDFEKRSILSVKCKHIWAVEMMINNQTNEDGSTTIAKTTRVTYGQNWSAYNQAQTHEKELFQKLLFDLCGDIQNPVYVRGRPR